MPDTEHTPENPCTDNPWPGLASYTADQRFSFFGREKETRALRQMIQRERLTVLFGRSGLGKTSLLRAGVIPELQEENHLAIFLRLDYGNAGFDPVQQIKALTQESVAAHAVDIDGVADLPPDATLWEYFHAAAFWSARNDELHPLLVFDQFEEIFTLGQEDPRQKGFLRQLADLVENRVPREVSERLEKVGQRLNVSRDVRYKIVLGIREDFVPKLDQLRPLMPAVMRNRFPLTPFSGENARAIILCAGGTWVRSEVAEQIIDFVSGSSVTQEEIEPAYLSVMCHELFEHMCALGGTEISADLVEQKKGDILESLYARSLQGMPPSVQHFIENHLLTNTGFRATVPVPEAQNEGISADQLATLVDRRLLRFEDRLGTRHVELSHDLLTGVVLKSREEWRKKEKQKADLRKTIQLKRQLKRARTRTAMASGVALFLAGGSICTWMAFSQIYIVYSANYKKEFGVMKPLDRISANQASHRACTYRAKIQGFWHGGQVQAFDTVDSNDTISDTCDLHTPLNIDEEQDRKNQFGHITYVYDNNGDLVYEKGWNKAGQMLYGLTYAPTGNAADNKRVRVATFVGPDGIPQPQRNSHAEVIQFYYDKKGNDIRRYYLDDDGIPTPGPYNAYGHAQRFDGRGHLIFIASLNIHHEIINDIEGTASIRIRYDPEGNPIRETNFDSEDNITNLIDARGYSTIKRHFDTWGNLTELSFFDARGNPVISGTTNCHHITYQRDMRGNITEQRCTGLSGLPRTFRDSGTAVIRYSYDRQNHMTGKAFFNAGGMASVNYDGVHSYTYSFDKNGYIATECKFSTNGTPMTEQGFHQARQTNDENGNTLQIGYFGIHGEVATREDGRTHMQKMAYDSHGREIRKENYDLKGQRIPGTSDHAFRIVKTYDRFDNITSRKFFDTALRPQRGITGCHEIRNSYNTYGQQKDYYCLNAAGAEISDSIGLSHIHWSYDDAGLLTDIRYFNRWGNPARYSSGDAWVHFTYNEKRQVTVTEHFGPSGPRTDTAFREVTTYDAAGRRISQTSYDTKGRVMQNRTQP